MEENDDNSFTITAYMSEDDNPFVVVAEGGFEDFIRSIEGSYEMGVKVAEKMTVIPDSTDSL